MYSTNNRSLTVLYLLSCLLMLILSLMQGNYLLIIVSVIMLLLINKVNRSNSDFYGYAILACFVLDQISFSLAGSTFRVYYFIAIVLTIFNLRYIGWAFKRTSAALFMLLMFYFIIICSLNGNGSLWKFFGIIIQLFILLTVCLTSESMQMLSFDWDYYLTKALQVCAIFGIFQLILYKITGIAIGFSKALSINLSVGQIPSFRYEGNAFGKLVCWGIIFILPIILKMAKSESTKYRRLFYLLIIILLLSMTRAALYALLITVTVLIVWYSVNDRMGFSNSIKLVVITLGIALVAVLIISSGVVELGSYSQYKLSNLFVGFSTAKDDVSANFRLESMRQGLKIWTASPKNFLFGVGYLNAQGDLSSIGGLANAEVGGSEIIILAESFGLIGVMSYLLIYLYAIVRCLKLTKYANSENCQLWGERVAFAAFYGLALQFFSADMLCPEFWITLGLLFSYSGNEETE